MTQKKHNILVVDDQPDIRRVVRAYLETALGCAVAEAGDGLEAVARLREADYDLVICDLVMPGMTGLELAGWIRRDQRLRRLPIVMLTSQGEERDRRRAAALGVDEYLVKPFDPLSLGPVLKRLLR